MALPRHAKIEAAPNFLANLDAAHQFFRVQDADNAESRLSKLKTELREMVALLAWSPASGRSARFLSAKSAQATIKANTVLQLAKQAGLPSLREYIVGQYQCVILYAHSETDVVLLAIKHQRQLRYLVES